MHSHFIMNVKMNVLNFIYVFGEYKNALFVSVKNFTKLHKDCNFMHKEILLLHMQLFCWEIKHYLTFYDCSLTIKHNNKQKTILWSSKRNLNNTIKCVLLNLLLHN